MMATNQLLGSLFDDPAHVLVAPLDRWIAASPHFAAFVNTYRDKIRKKARGTRGVEALRDLEAELETAYLLLRAGHFAVAYEPHGTGKTRAPDFTVTAKTRVTFNVEVTRMRASRRADCLHREEARSADDDAAVEPSFDRHHHGGRLADIVCGKLGQLLPSMINVLVVVAEGDAMAHLDVPRAMTRLKDRAERRETSLFTRHGFRGTPDFFKHYQRLSGLLVRSAWDPESGSCPILWTNSQAKHPIPAKILALLHLTLCLTAPPMVLE